MRPRTLGILAACATAALVPGMFAAPKPSQAMPTFAQAYGVKCSTCHTMVPLLNAYGRYVQRTGYASLDRDTLNRALPVWIDESMAYDSSAGAGTGVPRYSFGNLALHGVGYVAPDTTFHAQQWITQGDQAGGLDTLWVTYNNLLHRDGHLFVGKVESIAPSPLSQSFDLDGPAATSTVVGEHDWGATFDNRWGTKMNYVHNEYDIEAGYLGSGDDLNGATEFGAIDKTFQWKAAIARPDRPFEYGLFGSTGTVPVSTGNDHYNSIAAYMQLDPQEHGVPGILAIAQQQHDSNPGYDGNTGLLMPGTSSHALSLEVYEPLLNGNVVVSARHDINNDGFHTTTVGNSLNLGFNLGAQRYVHGYLEVPMGATSSLYGASGGPTWKGMLWLTLPIRAAK